MNQPLCRKGMLRKYSTAEHSILRGVAQTYASHPACLVHAEQLQTPAKQVSIRVLQNCACTMTLLIQTDQQPLAPQGTT